MESAKKRVLRRWPLAEKRRIVELTLSAGVPIRAIAREQGVHPTSLSHWRTQYRAGNLNAGPQPMNPTFVPVRVVPDVQPRLSSSSDRDSRVADVVHLTFASGASLRFERADIDVPLLCALIAELR